MADGSVRGWHLMTSSEAAVAAAQDPVVILPLAAIEQHGPHLPLSTDLDIGLGLIERAFDFLPRDLAAWTLPPVSVGTSEEHMMAPGTLSLSPDQLIGVIVSQGAGLARAGVRRLVLANSHGGNRHAMNEAGLILRAEHDMLIVKASYFRFSPLKDVDLPDSEWRHGLHGGAIETAMMLHLQPGLVRSKAITRFPSLGEDLEKTMRRLGPEGQASFAWLADDLNPEGVVGDAALASAVLGERLVEHYARALADVILDASEFPIGRLSSAHGAL